MEPTQTHVRLTWDDVYPPPPPKLTHTLNADGRLGMFVNPDNCDCTTCVEYCNRPKTQDCWGCGKEIPYNKEQPYCTVQCAIEDDERDREARACCTGCCEYHQEFAQENESTDEDLDYEYPEEEDEEEKLKTEYCEECCKYYKPEQNYKGYCSKSCYKWSRVPDQDNTYSEYDSTCDNCGCGYDRSDTPYPGYCGRRCMVTHDP